MAGSGARWNLLYIVSFLAVGATIAVDSGYFSGGTMSFYFIDTSNKDTYRAHVTVITGWVLGHGPCGPGCSVSDVGKSTHSSRASVIQSTGNPVIFGNWSKEQEITGIFPTIDEVSITDIVNQNIQGRVSAVSTRLNWEQEIAHVEVDIETKYTYTDVVLNGDSWKAFDLNHDVSNGNNGGGVLPSRAFNLQTKIYPQIRNDTGIPNNSPLVLYKPIYRVQLNNVTRIYLTSSDKDGDYIKCRAGRNIEITGIGLLPNVTISEDCVLTVSAMEQDGFRDDSWGVITVVLEDFNRQPIKRGNKNIRPYATSGLSSSILDFMVWVVANMTVPEFVSPTPVSQHVYTVYAGSKLSISLAARPSPQSPPTTQVVEFHLLSLPDHTLKARPLHPDPQRVSDRVVTSRVEWRTSDSDAGDFIIQVVAIDSDGFESLDRNYKIHVSDFQQDLGRKVSTKPYFPFFPAPGSITCPQGATCSLPIFASPGIASHVISSIGIVDARTAIPGIKTGRVERVTYRGVQTFRADVHLTSDMLGQQPVCIVAQDDHGLETERCVDVSLYPPNPCDSLPCGNHATCIPDGINFTCICIPAYGGPLCDQWLDPCLHGPPDRCANGKCISKISYGAQFVCQCDPGFTGHFSCVDINDCHLDTCKNGGNCEDKINRFECHCVNGYTGHDCSTAPTQNPCVSKNCTSGSTCVVNGGTATAECKCPLIKKDDTCGSENKDPPLIQPQGTTTPHSVLPTLRPGTRITCSLGSTCQVPVYLSQGSQRSPPKLVRGMTSPGLTTSVTQPVTDTVTGLPNTLTSSLSVTPQKPGNHSVCVEVENSSGTKTEEICYTVYTPQTVGQPAAPTGQKTFTDQTPPDGSVINCVTSQPCHILPRTKKPASGNCEEVHPATQGAYAFETHADQTSDSCATDILLEPTTTPTDRVCLVVGIGGERRCYIVNTIDDSGPSTDPCKPNPCLHGGVCMPDTGANGYTCVCPVPYSGHDCSQVDQCSSDRCEHQAVCVPDASPSHGFRCECQPGYGPATSHSNCRHEPDACRSKNCENGALCVLGGSVAVCKCPVEKGGGGGNCHDDTTHRPVGPVGDTSKPHAVVPSPGHGTTIHCDVGSTCSVPVYMTGDPGTPPHVTTGPTSMGLTADVTPPKSAKLPNNTLLSSLTVNPTTPGFHHVCVEIRDTPSASHVENVCYNIDSSTSSPQPGQSGTSTPAPSSVPSGGRFVGGTPPDGSKMMCVKGTPCHIIAQTQRPTSGDCTEVRTQSVGVYTFPKTDADSATCVTDVLIDPAEAKDPSSTPPRHDACIQVGLTGEKRCFPVTAVDPTHGPCNSNPCKNGGVCVPDSRAAGAVGYSCVCPVPYKDPTCSTTDTCSSGRCLNQAVCTDKGASGFDCGCQSGYSGDDCRHVPHVCAGVHCEHGALCVEESGHGVCKCPVGYEGETCHTDNTDIPIDPDSDYARPHLVVPSPGNGFVINCGLHQPCSVPIAVKTSGGSAPNVTVGPSSPHLTTEVTPPKAPSVNPNTHVSSLTVTPTKPGQHHVCVNVGDTSGTADTVCYTVKVDPSQAATTAPTAAPTGGKFTGVTPPDGSTITCRDDIPCHIIALTQAPGSKCPDVQPQTVGVFTFHSAMYGPPVCAADVLVDPTHIAPAGSQACIQVGADGERRCYDVNTVNSSIDPCSNVDCHNGGHCIPDGTGGHTCVCPVPYKSGPDCNAVDDCQAGRCLNQAACRQGAGITGFECRCQPGYHGPDCGQAPGGCASQHCAGGALCVEEGGHPVCKCPLGRANHPGNNCTDVDTDIPLNHNANKTKPHSVVPSPGNGFQINCNVGETCDIPVYIHGVSGTPPEVTPGLMTPGINGSLTPPTRTSVLPDTLTSTLSVTPSTPGTHHVCVHVGEQIVVLQMLLAFGVVITVSGVMLALSVTSTDTVCYTIKSQTQGHGQATTPAPAGGHFTGGTPPDGALITCRDDRPCHVIAQTEKPPGSAACDDVKSQATGVYTFPASADGQTCNTDVMLDVKHIGNNQACIQVGTDGEQRCFTVQNVDHSSDPCDNSPCQHGGQCVNMPLKTPGYDCVCPPLYRGHNCEDHTDEPVNKNANKSEPHAVVPTPANGLNIRCDTGSTCNVPVYVTGGGTVTPGPHTSGIETSITGTVAPHQPHEAHVSSLSVHPVTDGQHHVCVNIEHSGKIVDDICYNVVSVTQTTISPATPFPLAGARFVGLTLPSAANINCRQGVPCHLLVQTDKLVPNQCIPVRVQNGPAAPTVQPTVSPWDSNKCDTDILVDQSQLQGQSSLCIKASMTASSDGEERCYTVRPISDADDLCSSNQCQNGGECVLLPMAMAGGFRCVCPDGYSGTHCELVTTTTTPSTSTTTELAPSTTTDIVQATTAVPPCQAKGCSPDAKCAVHQGIATCLCPLGKSGVKCTTATTTAVNEFADTSKAHAVVPTPPGGSRILCETHSTCNIPVYVTGGQVTAGAHTPDIQTSTSPLIHTTSPPGCLTSVLSVTPATDGDHHVCFDVTDTVSQSVDSVCYTIVSSTTTGQPPQTTPGPNGGRFTDNTLPDGSHILCHTAVPCHLIAGTHKPTQGNCVRVRTKDSGSFAFPPVTSPVNSSTCETDILIDPPHLVPGQGTVCLEAQGGPNNVGEKRCYTVSTVSNADDKCSSSPCHNRGRCELAQPPPTFHCVCADGYTGTLCETEKTTTAAVSSASSSTKGQTGTTLPVSGGQASGTVGGSSLSPGTGQSTSPVSGGQASGSVGGSSVSPGTGQSTSPVSGGQASGSVGGSSLSPGTGQSTSPVSGGQTSGNVGGSSVSPGTGQSTSPVSGGQGSGSVGGSSVSPGTGQSTSPGAGGQTGTSPSTGGLSVTTPSPSAGWKTSTGQHPQAQTTTAPANNGVSAPPVGAGQCASSTQCYSQAPCVNINGADTCQCPVGTQGPTCQPGLSPVNPQVNQNKTHLVEPTPLNGFEIKCNLNTMCTVPLYVSGPDPHLAKGPSSPNTDLHVIVTKPGPTGISTFPADTRTSLLVVTPRTPGRHHLCVDVSQNSNSQITDTICYVIDTPSPQTVTTSAPSAITGPATFTKRTPPEGSQITCHENRSCHIVVGSSKQGATCDDVQSDTTGVYTNPLSGTACLTDVIVNPRVMSVPHQACIHAGANGERRCYPVAVIPSGQDPCDPNPCQNGGVCVNTPTQSPKKYCACRDSTFVPDDSCGNGQTSTLSTPSQSAAVPLSSAAGHVNPTSVASTASQGGPASISSTLAVGQSSPTPGQMGSASSHAGTSSTPSAGGPTSTGQHLQGTPTSQTGQTSTLSTLGPSAAVPLSSAAGRVNPTSVASTASQGGPTPMSSTLAVGQGSSTQGAVAGGQGSSTQGAVAGGQGSSTSGQMGSASLSSAASHVGTSSTPSAGGQASTSQHLQGTPTTPVMGQCASSTQCQSQAPCVNINGADTCRCPIGTQGPNCQPGGALHPVNPDADPLQPHLVQPTPGKGSEVQCRVNAPCSVPLYVSGPTPYLVPGPSSPELSVHVDQPVPANIPAFPSDAQISPLTVTPSTPGRHHVCVDVKRGPGSQVTDAICYFVNAVLTPTVTTNAPPAGSVDPHFTSAPPAGSQVVCHQGIPCHVLVTTSKGNGNTFCGDAVRSDTRWVSTTPLTIDRCTTDVIVDTNTIDQPLTGPHQTCLHIGTVGEKRCYTVAVIPKAQDPCSKKPCQNGGVCVNTPTHSPKFKCICRDSSTTPTCGSLKLAPQGQCSAQREALRKAAAAGRVRCTCLHPVTNVTYTVIKPRVSNERLLRAAGISSGVSIGLMAVAAIVYFLVRKIKNRMASAAPSVRPTRGPRLQGRESAAWPERGGNFRR